MKLKHLIGISSIFMLMLVIHACSTDYTLSEDDEALEIIDPDFIIYAPKYCKYNVTESSVPGTTTEDQVCFPCSPPCVKTITDRPFIKITPNGNDTIGFISGNSGTGHKRCRSCNGAISHI